jgi:hypothetical protein
MQGLPPEEDWERAELSEGEQELASKLAGLMQLTTNAQYHMYEFFDSIEPAIRAAVYQSAIKKLAEGMEGQTHEGSRRVN